MNQTISVRGPFKGINKLKDPAQLLPNEASDALNLIVNKKTIQKRDGWVTRIRPSPAACLGIFELFRPNGQQYILFKSGKKLFVSTSIGGAVTELGSDIWGTSTQLGSFAIVNGVAYLCDTGVLKVTDGISVYDAAILRPTGPPTVNTGGGGNLRGTYDYKYTFYSSPWGQESYSSDQSSSIVFTGVQANLSNLLNSVDPRVDKRRIYRRKTSAFETEWSFVAEINNGPIEPTTYTDNLLDNDIDFSTIAPFSLATALPAFKYLTFNAGCLFGVDNTQTKLFFSEADQPWVFDQFLTVGSLGDGEKIGGLASFHGALIIFKERSIWSLTGNSEDTFYLRKVKPGVGSSAHFSIVPVDDLLYFLGPRGFYAFDGADTREISAEISPDLQPRDLTFDPLSYGVQDIENAAVWWTNGATPPKMWAYFYRESRELGVDCWIPWDLGNVRCFGIATANVLGQVKREKEIGFGDGFVGGYGGGTNADAGGNIQAFWRTGKLDLGAPNRKKAWREFAAQVTRQISSTNLTVSYFLDNDTGSTPLVTKDQTSETIRSYIHRSSKDLRLELGNNSTGTFEIRGYALEGEIAGRAT